jgi:AmmeMemoRadiSam system protein B
LAQLLPRLRANLDFLPSPSPEHPGLLIRDPYKFSDAMLILPPILIEVLECFDGRQTDLDLRAALVRLTQSLEVGDTARNLAETLSAAGFLEDERFRQMREERLRDFAEQPVRAAAHAGSAYPENVEQLRAAMASYFSGSEPAREADGVFAIAAPHVSPEGGWQSYRDAYRVLQPNSSERTIVILATSHYGTPQKFGLTRKNFATPFGEAVTDQRLVNELEKAGGSAVEMEDYCFSFEHTVEFQVVFLQYLLGPNVRILPILCGAFARSLYEGGRPEDDEGVKRFFDALGELNARERNRLFWVLGVDMAHMGARYGDRFEARANQGPMSAVAARDAQRIERINQNDAAGFWELVRENHDDLKWCGASPFYTFLKSVPEARGELLRYEQWNIDEKSVVSFAGIAFTRS